MRGVTFRAFLPGTIILVICLASAAIAYSKASLVFGRVLLAYLIIALATTFVWVLIWVFHRLWLCMMRKADNPLAIVLRRLRTRVALLLLPTVISPLFLSGYTTAKTAIPRLVSYNWDAAFTAIDRAIFRVDPWIITHALISQNLMSAVAFVYAFWGVVLVTVQALIVLYARGRTISIFYMTMFSTWLVGGVWLAYAFASGGPAFAHLLDPALRDHFKPLLTSIPSDSFPGRTQAYLAARFGTPLVDRGGGISAMPSMHVATVMIYVMAARKTRWFWPAAAFAFIIFVGSVHLAFHYAVDGIVSALLVVVLWQCSAAVYGLMVDAERARGNRRGLQLGQHVISQE